MPRRQKNFTAKTTPDPIYQNSEVTKLINKVMKEGKKSVAQTQVYKSFEIIKDKTKKDPLSIFIKALNNIKPTMEVRPRRIGGAAYQIPMQVRGPRRESLAIRWLVVFAQARPSSELRTFPEKLAAEIIDASNQEGGAIKKRTDMEKMAEANRAFAHFRW